MWADTLLLAERTHLVLLLLWGASSVVAGTALSAALTVRRARSPLLTHFAVQTIAWGAVVIALAALGLRGLALRDLSGATRLDRFVWFRAGLDLGCVAVGATLAVTGWRPGRRLALVGAGVGIIMQGLALAILDLRFLGVLARMV